MARNFSSTYVANTELKRENAQHDAGSSTKVASKPSQKGRDPTSGGGKPIRPMIAARDDHEISGFVHQGDHASDWHHAAYPGAGKGRRHHLGRCLFRDDRNYSRGWLGGSDELLDHGTLSAARDCLLRRNTRPTLLLDRVDDEAGGRKVFDRQS